MHIFSTLIHNACNPCYSFVSEGKYDKVALELHLSTLRIASVCRSHRVVVALYGEKERSATCSTSAYLLSHLR